jgi:hypothetical protein
MADIFIYNLTTIGSIDAANDWMIIEDTSVGETKKAAPGQLPISTATQAALDTKVDENAPIAAATKAKITYDAKGLVTAGADLSASDMPTGINAANISSGLISNAEFDYLNGLSDNIQTQLNGKQQSLTLTTTGTSGAATLVGGTLNIPQYSGGGASGVSQIVAGTNVTISPVGGTGVVTINATGGGGGGGGTVTNVSALTLGTSGTDLSSTVANSTTTPVITLNVPNASASNRGALTSTDWSTFNGKQDTLVSATNIKTINSTSVLGSGDIAVQATLVSGTNIKTINSTSLLGSGDIAISASPSGVAGAIQFSDGSAFASDAANLFWDDTNNRLGIGTNAPTNLLHVSNACRLSNIYIGQAGNTAISNTGSDTTINLSNGVGIAGGSIITPTARLHVKGSGSTSATTSLLVQNSAGNNALQVTDDRIVKTFNGLNLSGSYLYANGVGTASIFGGTSWLFDATSGGSFRFRNGSMALGVSVADATAHLDVQSTTKGFLPPRMTTTQKNAISSPAEGLIVYDTTLGKLCVRTASAWETITSV